MNNDTEYADRQFWIDMRRGLLMLVDGIEKRYLVDKREESAAAREWLKARRTELAESVESTQTK